jgi:hypothetical protein
MNEVFGEENFVGIIVWRTATDNNATQIATEHEYVVCYARDLSCQDEWSISSSNAKLILKKYQELKEKYGEDLDSIQDELTEWIHSSKKEKTADLTGAEHYCFVDKNGVFYPGNSANTRPGGYDFDITHPVTGKVCAKPKNGYRWPKRTFDEALVRGDALFGPDHESVPKIKKRLETATELLRGSYYEDSRRTTRELSALMGASVFDNPKSPRFLKRLMVFCAQPNSIVLDFFAGSCTTAEAVLRMNRDDRRAGTFVVVQIPELTPDDSTARKSGYRTIAEIGKERIRRVIKKLKDEAKGKLDLKDRETPEDLGFKVFKLAESNYRRWRGTDAKTGDALLAEMEKMADPLLPGWKPANVIYEVALKEGYSLTCSIKDLKNTGGNKVYLVTDPDKGQSFRICLDDVLKSSTIKALKLGRNDLFICRDVALTDEQAANLALQCNLKTI